MPKPKITDEILFETAIEGLEEITMSLTSLVEHLQYIRKLLEVATGEDKEEKNARIQKR